MLSIGSRDAHIFILLLISTLISGMHVQDIVNCEWWLDKECEGKVCLKLLCCKG